jgi:hypothetical protein
MAPAPLAHEIAARFTAKIRFTRRPSGRFCRSFCLLFSGNDPMASAVVLRLTWPAVVWGNRWTVALRCYRCSGRFTVEDVAFDRVNGVSLVVPCPACGARPFIAAPGGAEASRMHLLELLGEREESAPGVRVRLGLKPEWYNRLAAWAFPGSDAERCLKDSRLRRETGEYIVECDGDALVALAALADSSSCPEAIRAMRQAYLETIEAK